MWVYIEKNPYNQREAIMRLYCIQRRLFCLLRESYHFIFWQIYASWPNGLCAGYVWWLPYSSIPVRSHPGQNKETCWLLWVRRDAVGWTKEKKQCRVGVTIKGCAPPTVGVLWTWWWAVAGFLCGFRPFIGCCESQQFEIDTPCSLISQMLDVSYS